MSRQLTCSIRIIYSFLIFSLLGCSRAGQGTFQTGSKPFQFEPQNVSEVTISKFDPLTGDRWTTILRRDMLDWQILFAPYPQQLLDRKANQNFISHLVDSLESIRIQEQAPHGTLESLGLDPPRFSIRWVIPRKSFEFHLGSSLKNRPEAFFTLDKHHVYIASGPTIGLLNALEDFQMLRRKIWSSIDFDQVDELEIFHQGKQFLYAQREGDEWTDRHHKVIQKQNVSLLIDELTSSEALGFVDNIQENSKLIRLLRFQPLYEAQLSDRFGNKYSLTLNMKNKKIYGWNSKRPKVIFILKPKLLKLFLNLKPK